MSSQFECKVCKNKDPKYIGYLNGVPYCRRCIAFFGECVSYTPASNRRDHRIFINYKLSNEQYEVSNKTLANFKEHINTLIYAVCGAGKTELVFETISYALKNNLRIGFAVPRRDVVIELGKRLQKAFKNNFVVCVFGGNHKILEGDIICLTTHQLFRYENYFDLLILDEIDAFPYKGDFVLHNLFKRSVRGNYILMSATPDEKTLNEFKKENHSIIKLFHRYHKKEIPVPKIKIIHRYFKIIYCIYKLKKYKKLAKPCLIFVPTIFESEFLFKIIHLFFKGGNYVNSKKEDRSEIIEDFRKEKYSFLVTTAVLERGVTLKNLQVIIYGADNYIYNSAALIQISGRVGRVIGAEDGEIIYLCSKVTDEIKKAIDFTKKANQSLQDLLQASKDK